MNGAIVAVVGRPNVGKSALFNRLTGRHTSIVEDVPGVTRDRLYGECEWGGRIFTLVDTGGLEPASSVKMRKLVREQTEKAMDEASLLLFLVDGQEGINPIDQEVADAIRRSRKPVLLVVNKMESPRERDSLYEFYSLGLGDPIFISAIHGTNTGDLLDLVLDMIREETSDASPDDPVTSIAVVGRPNVGKSSLVNALLGKERSLVDNEAGTTRDAIDSPWEYGGQPFLLIDTAGLRRKGKVEDKVEYYSTVRALRAVKRADIAVLVLDAVSGIVSQDRKIAGYVLEQGKASVILVNKWDLVEDSRRESRDGGIEKSIVRSLKQEMDFVDYSPVLFISALRGTGLEDVPEAILEVSREYSRRVETPILNRVLRDAFAFRPPPSYKGKTLKLFYASQCDTRPPTFLLKVNSSRLVHFSYRRYLENRLREVFGFIGCPIRLIFKSDGRA
jgi:GTP-binding protein